MINKLFIYGSLLQTDNEFGRYLKQNSKLYKQGNFKGKLFDVGEYPGAITYPNSDYCVHGMIVQIDTPIQTLKHIDDYEGFGDDQLQPNLFTRELLDIETDNEIVECWVYLYNHPITNLPQIISGDYLAYKRA